MHRSVLILGLIGALVAPSAHAAWLKSCQAGMTTGSLTAGGQFVCHNPASVDDDPGLLDISACENVDIIWFDNQTGDGSGDADGTATLYTCPMVAAAALDTEAERLAGCQPMNNGTGTALSATVSEIYGVGGVKIWADVELASAENQLIVRCSQPSGHQ